jgi:hypothetical protein
MVRILAPSDALPKEGELFSLGGRIAFASENQLVVADAYSTRSLSHSLSSSATPGDLVVIAARSRGGELFAEKLEQLAPNPGEKGSFSVFKQRVEAACSELGVESWRRFAATFKIRISWR